VAEVLQVAAVAVVAVEESSFDLTVKGLRASNAFEEAL
jgi:hypothetical protein